MQNVRSLLLRLVLEELVNAIHKCFLNLKHPAVSFFCSRLFRSLGAKAFLLGVKASVMKKFQMFMESVKKFRFNNLAQEEGPLSLIK